MEKKRAEAQKQGGNGRTGGSKWDLLTTSRQVEPLGFGSADPALLRGAVAAAVDDGNALLFGRTSDGGALLLQLLDGGPAKKLYCTSPEELHMSLSLIVQIALG